MFFFVHPSFSFNFLHVNNSLGKQQLSILKLSPCNKLAIIIIRCSRFITMAKNRHKMINLNKAPGHTVKLSKPPYTTYGTLWARLSKPRTIHTVQKRNFQTFMAKDPEVQSSILRVTFNGENC